MSAGNRGRIQRAVKALLSQGFGQAELDPAVEIGAPIPVVHPDGTQRSWFVPLVAGTKLAGFAELLPSLTPLRMSSFQRRGRIDEHAPNVSDWTDLERIRARALSLTGEAPPVSTRSRRSSADITPAPQARRFRRRSRPGIRSA